MTRAFDDKTSTCGSCSYWEHNQSADGLHPTRLGWCNWVSVPAWVDRLSKQPLSADHRKMREDGGKECWLHTKRELPVTQPEKP